MPMMHRMATLVAAAVLAACGAPKDDAGAADSLGAATAPPAAGTLASHPLADSDWWLAEFQSMDDAQGTTTSSDSTQVTMHLGGDGTMQVKFACNTGTGTWTSEPGADGTSGTFALGPIAATLMACPEPGLADRFSKDAPHVTGFMLRDGKLNLTLMADGGIYVWEPIHPGAM